MRPRLRLRLLATVLVFVAERALSGTSERFNFEELEIFTQPPLDFTLPDWWDTHRRFCSGSTNSRSKPGIDHGIDLLRLMYQNCTRVFGNVEITHLAVNSDADPVLLDFFDQIEEIKGYLLIYDSDVDFISFKNLKVIWGDEVHDDKYALQIENSDVKSIFMPNLRSVINGSVRIENSQYMCHLNQTIDWKEIITPDFENRYSYDDASFISCGSMTCHSDCESKHCWGTGADHCQTVYRSMCSDTCALGSNACFLTNSTQKSPSSSVSKVYECCHPECAAGCYGPGSSMCYACKSMLQDWKCVSQCTSLKKYDRAKGRTVFNPNGYYTHDRYCVKSCPSETLIQGDHCVRHCSEGFYHDGTYKGRECIKCDGGKCPKSCVLDEDISKENIGSLIGCNSIDGKLVIRRHVFNNDKAGGLTFSDLQVLRSVKSVSEYVEISNFPYLNLSFLDMLEVIEGRRLSSEKYALLVSMSDSLTQLQLRSLREVKKGDVLISRNFGLCYANETTFAGIMAHGYGAKVIGAMSSDECATRKKRCHPSCVEESGCWGKGPRMCRKCKNWRKEGSCEDKCPVEGYFQINSSTDLSRECVACSPHCLTCYGPDKYHCLTCRNVKVIRDSTNDIPKEHKQPFLCDIECPANHFANESNVCESCDKTCYDNGCTGRSVYVEKGGCNKCRYGVFDEIEVDGRNTTVERCLYGEDRNTVCIDNGLFSHFLTFESVGKELETTCKKCDEQCISCSGYGISIKDHGCQCRNYMYLDHDEVVKCGPDCSRGYLISKSNWTNVGKCGKCSNLCEFGMGCEGPGPDQCHRCKNASITENNTTICVAKCPPNKPYLIKLDRRCSEVDIVQEQKMRMLIIVAIVLAIIMALLIVTGIIFCRCNRYKKELELEKEFNGPTIPEQIEIDPMVRPNMSRITLISSDELSHKGKKLGAGAFGVVYAGFYKKNNKKVPVAIKVLQDLTGKAQLDMLDEATKMAMMRHEHLLKLVGVCLSQGGIQLVTLLRPLGNLLGYLKKHRQYLIGKDLLLYCYQIASAMKYLYEHRLVHRDLAARNVLVKQNNHVEVTDFGLAELIDYGRDTVTVSEGKVAYKWLAPESLQRAEYTHATDVWAFGVTCWEILTYGQSPYQGMDMFAVRDFVLFGEKRLEQPNNCSIELYSTLLRCWMSNPDSRPTFVSLKDDFHGYCRAPRLFVTDPHTHSDYDGFPAEGQTALLQEILDDTETDFQDPLEYDDSLSEAGTLAGSRSRRLTSTNSQRYQTDPVERGKKQVQMDEGNYLVPNREAGGILYTPVVVNERGDTELFNSHDYYNEVVANPDYYNDPSKVNNNKLLPIEEAPQENSGGVDIESCL